MNNFDLVKVLLSNMAGSQHHITVNTTFVKFMDELECGVFLSQLIYWSDRGGRKDGWFYKTQKEWEEEIGIKRRAINRCIKKLEGKKILKTKVMKVGGAPTTHYKLDMDVLTQELKAFLQKEHSEANAQMDLHERTNGNVQSYNSEMHERTNGNVRTYKSSITKNTNIDYSKDYDKKEVSSSFGEIIQLYEELVPGSLNSFIVEKMEYDFEEHGLDLMKKAFEIAALNNKRNYNYISGILRNWKNKGIHSVEELELHESQRTQPQEEQDDSLDYYKNIILNRKE